MSNHRDIALLVDIATAAQRILTFSEGITRDAFESDPRTHLAVQHQIMVIGECAKRLSPEVRSTMDTIPWAAVARMRDRLIHGYDTVDLEIVWDTTQRNIPMLLKAVKERLKDFRDE